ncbi:MAG: DUF2071 domain-containing protein [Planctomycetes bacterium]|nr:DUF2071 domain-containing protein [Planctomycetota bacterium]
MRIPVIEGVIDRRVLANWRCDPAVVARLLPPPLRPKLAGGHAIAGVCLIRLKAIRPRLGGLVPGALGISSENAAHRIAVEWDEAGGTREGVYVPRRDTSSRLNALVGGRLFPGVHHRARFDVREDADRLRIAVESEDGATRLLLDARRAEALPPASVFPDLARASAFFEAGACGYSPGRAVGELDGLELRTRRWEVEPLAVDAARSSFFDDPTRFPPGSAVFDCALLMRGIEHEWRALPGLRAAAHPRRSRSATRA